MKKYKFILIAFFFAIVLNLIIQHVDNKYTYNDIEAIYGIVDYTDSSQMHFLIHDWEVYQDQLLTSEDIKNKQGQLTQYVDVGEFGGFEFYSQNQKAHGQATYRIRIYDQPQKVVAMQLPEIFSAYKLYINGQLYTQSGIVEKENYTPEILNTMVTFTTQECNEIIIQVSDYDHYYSGMIYPIAYGSQRQISIYQTIQTLIKGLQSFLPLVMAIVCIVSYWKTGYAKRDGYFACICLSYLGYILYAIVHLLINSQSFLWYRLEDISYYLLIYFVALLLLQQCHYKISRIYSFVGLFVLIATLFLPSLWISYNQDMIYGLSYMGQLYKGLFSFLMIFIIFRNVEENMDSSLKYLIMIIILFVVSINMDSIFWYEPIYLGWGSEIAGFVLIVYFSIIMVSEKIQFYQQNKILSENKKQMKDYIFDVAHDLKAPAASLYGYVELLNSGIAKKQNKEEYLLSQIAQKVQILSKRIALLQTLDIEKSLILNKNLFSLTKMIESLEQRYQILLQDKQLEIKIIGQDIELYADQEKISICLENILLNAIEHAYSNSAIVFELLEDALSYQIQITNHGKIISKEDMNHIFERGYTSHQNEHSGLGLAICQKIIQAHVGEITVQSLHDITTFIIVFIKKIRVSFKEFRINI